MRKEETHIAIYHLSIQIIGRGSGKTAVAAAAYRAGEKITNDYDGVTHDYTRKGGVVHTEILLPEYASAEYTDRAMLWNAVEKIEKAKNSQLAREIEIALPLELSQEQNIELVRAYCQQHFISAGMCADICFHEKEDGNPHVHIMLTMRPFEQDGSWAAKSKKEYILDENSERIMLKSGEYKSRKVDVTNWNDRGNAKIWRQGWADLCNQYLEKNSHTERIDHRSYEQQGIEQIPMVHLGAAASAMEKRGIKTERGDINRKIEITNSELRQLNGRINKLKNWIYAQPIADAPTMLDVMKAVSSAKNVDSKWKRIADVKTQSKLLVFLQENGIDDIAGLVRKVEQLHQSQYELGNTIKSEERRISTLKQHLAQVDIYKTNKAVHKQYKNLDIKKRDGFYDKHSDEILAYESASKYLNDHLNGYDKIPEKDWRAEHDKLLTQRHAHVEEYYKRKDDVKEVELIRRSVGQSINNVRQKDFLKNREQDL